MQNNVPMEKNSPQALETQEKGGRRVLLLVMILTAVNLVSLLLDTNYYFLFSASVPYYLVFIGKGIENGFVNGAWDYSGTLTYTGLVIALIVLAVYLLCWLLSKKHSGWLVAATVLFILDTVALVAVTFFLYDNPMINLKDFIFHALVIWSMISGCRAAAKRKKLSQEQESGFDLSQTTPDLD